MNIRYPIYEGVYRILTVKRHIHRRLQSEKVPFIRLLQSVVGRVRTAPGGVHHPRTVQGGERYPCVPYSRFGNRHICLP